MTLQTSDVRSRRRWYASLLNLSRTGKRLLLTTGIALAIICIISVVHSASLSGPVIVPGDLGVSPAPGMQFNPRIARGGNGFLSVWTDNRTTINGQPTGIGSPTTGTGRGTLDDIYAARLDADGNVIDRIPIIVSEAQYNQGGPRVGWNGQSWLVAWQTQAAANPSFTEIHAARVAPDGTVLDSIPLVISSSQSLNSITPAAVVSDGTNWVLMWEGFPQGSGNRSVFVARVSPSGVVLDPGGKAVYQHSSQYLDGPDIAFGGDGFLLTFVDISAGPNFENLLEGVRLNLNLDQGGAPFQISPAGTSVGSSHARLAFNGQHYMAVWEKGYPQTSHNPLVGSRISRDGQLLDQSPIQLVADMNSYAPQLDVCGDSSMWYASFDSANGTIGTEIRVARMTADGAPLDSNGITVHSGSRAAIASGVNGGAEVVFHDPAFDPTYTTSHVQGASVSSSGVVGATVPVSLGVPRQTRPRIAPGSNGYMAVFRSEAANDSRILAQRLDASANPIDAEPIIIANGSPTNTNPSVAFNGTAYLIVWQTGASGGFQTLGRRVTPEGVPLDAAPFSIMTGEQPDVAALGDSFLVANILQSGSQKRYVQSVVVSGAGAVQGTPTRLDFSFNFVPRVAAFGTRWLIVWEHHSNHDDSPGITYGAFVEQNGSTLGAFSVGSTGVTPALAVAGNSALIVWSNGNIVGRRINADGTFPDPPSGYTLVGAPNLQASPAVAWDGAQYVLDWIDQRNESYPVQPRGDIYGARVSSTNILLEEFPVATSQLPEETPFVIAANGVSVFAYAKFYDNAPYKTHRITLQTAQFAPPDLGTVPAAPGSLVVTEPNGDPNVNNLTWTDNSNNERGFKIESKIGSTGAWSQVAVVGPNVTSYTASPVSTTGPSNYFRVRSYGLAGDSAYSNEATPPNPPPVVSITSPANGAVYNAPALVVMSASASDSNGSIQKIDFYNGSNLLTSVTTLPYNWTLNNVPAGTYTLRAVATDNRGATTTSSPVTVTVRQQTDALILQQNSDGVDFFGPSVKTQHGTPVNEEVSDDIDVTGTITRILMNGYRDYNPSLNPPVYGVYVRFYEWQNGAPGALQAEQFIAAGSSNLVYDPATAVFFDITLPTPFTATGKHFMSVQVATDDAGWYWASSQTNRPRNSAVYHRNNLQGGVWTHPYNGDGAFSLYGTLAGSARIDTLSAASITRSGRFTVTGANFGGTQDTSRLLVDNVPAIVVSWGDSSITAYVPEAARIGTGQVQVETGNGLSNAKSLEVTARQQTGRVKWRFTVDGGYAQQKGAVGPDGTLYFNDSRGRLYALAADGGLKWIIQSGSYGTDSHISVGSDGTIYVPSSVRSEAAPELLGRIIAFNPNGTQKWQFTTPDASSVRVGPDIGPDGKIYAIFEPGSAQSLNLAALAPEDGHLVWNYYDKYSVQPTPAKQFGFDATAGLLYFQNTSLTYSSGGLYAHRLDNGQRVQAKSSGYGATIVAPDHSVHAQMQSFSPQFTLNWTIPLFGQGPTNTQYVGTDGIHYIVQNYYRLYAFNPNGTEKWHHDDCVDQYTCRSLNEPIASPTNQVIFVPGQNQYPEAGYFVGLSPASGGELWRVQLPVEPGQGDYGQVRPMNTAVFSGDGLTAYASTDIAAVYDYSYFYAIDTSLTLPCSVSISPLSKDFAANGGSSTIAVTSTATGCVWPVTSNANWITINSGASGTGNATVNYTVAANTTTSPRSGTINISGQTFTVAQAGVQPNAPTVYLISPANNASFTQPANIFVVADAAAASGRTLDRVEFYAGTQLIGTDNSAPYQIVWNDPATATYSLTARAIDNLGAMSDSAPVIITLLPPGGGLLPLPIGPPALDSPTAAASFTAPATISLSATPAASNYPTVAVEFYAGTALLGTDTDAPYSFTWTDVPAGRYTISARSIANTGARATSQPIDITVNGENFNINGRVLNNEGVPLAGVPVALNGSNFNNLALRASSSAVLNELGASGSATVTTDVNGAYTFSNLPRGGNFTVAPTASGVTFAPAQASFSGLRSDQAVTFIEGTTQPTARRQPADFDGDGRTDLSVWQSTSGIWHIINSTDNATKLHQWGQSSLGDVAVPGDYDGDGKTDVAIFRSSDGNWYILESSTGASVVKNWGQAGDRPAPADYDGDGKTDVAIFRASEGNWYVLKSTGGSIAQNWGDSTDLLVPGDYDGDGRADFAVFRPSDGNWYILKSGGGSFNQSWGLNGDRPVPGDYDGDGRTDMAVFRPSEGNWYILKSSGGNIIRNWGESTDRPVPGDYDGDGKTDMAVWRPSEGTWYIIKSGNNTSSALFLGFQGDILIPAAYLP
jgi:hypothetical protein